MSPVSEASGKWDVMLSCIYSMYIKKWVVQDGSAFVLLLCLLRVSSAYPIKVLWGQLTSSHKVPSIGRQENDCKMQTWKTAAKQQGLEFFIILLDSHYTIVS